MWRKLGVCVGLVLLQVIVAVDAVGQEQQLVGPLSDLSRMKIRGLQTFTKDEVRKGLSADFEVLLAAHPLAPLEDLPTVVRLRLLAGLQHGGFAEAEVRTEIDSEGKRLIATVSEGPRYVNGSVRIENAKQIDVDRLTQRLTEQYPPKRAAAPVFDPATPGRVVRWLDKDGKNVALADPVWTTDKPARMDTASHKAYEGKVKEALEDLGFRDAAFDVRLQPNREKRQVELVVWLRDEGDSATLGKIEIQGNERDSTEAIIDYMKLPIGTLMTRRRETQLRYDLYRSGRYTSIEVKLTKTPFDQQHVLHLAVKESPFSPPIDQSLTREEEALLKMGRWLANAKAWPSDMVVRACKEEIEATFTVAAGDGVVVSLRSLGSNAVGPIALVASPQEIGCYPAQREIYLKAATPATIVTWSMAYSVNDKPKEEGSKEPLQFAVGLGIQGKKKEEASAPFRVEFRVTPAACIAFAHTHNPKLTWEDDRLVVESEKGRIELDGNDGRLIHLRGISSDGEVEITFVDNGFAEARDATHQGADGGENLFDAKRPLRSMFDFLLHEDMHNEWMSVLRAIEKDELTQSKLDAFGAWSKFIAMGVLDPIDEYLAARAWEDDSEDEFKLPPTVPNSPNAWTLAGAALVIPGADALFPRDSWPWTVWRETCFVVAGRGKYTGRQLQRAVVSEDFGPVGLLVVSSLVDRMSRQASQTLAHRGTQRLSVAEFRRDYEPLLDETRITGKCIRRACEILRELSPAELRELQARTPDPWRPPFEAFSNELRRETDRPIDQAMPAALDAAWKAGLSDIIEQILIKTRDRNRFRTVSWPPTRPG